MAAQASALSGCDAYVIAGGLGTRIQPVLGETPKLLAPIAGRAYVDHPLVWLRGFGIKRVVFGLGHRAQAIVDHLLANPVPGVTTKAVLEPQAMGTAGALRLARSELCSDPVLVMNGDGIVECDLDQFFDFHRASRAAGTILVATVDDASQFGRVEREGNRITRFMEKDSRHSGPATVNAGVYLLSAALLDEIAAGDARSLESDVFAKLPPRTLAAFHGSGTFIDIGTPERLAAADRSVSSRPSSLERK